ncbi:ubiquinol-cytochrome C reductase hinge protein-domain-containing protein [Schizothecium vesticola]|uniref:Cytochrome b-c1 complex subunit 6, mitochondrial n=1 Tax=Schizothecium vesticola TaxID=314040 RepID=A0AA40K237_9PEZI|nr:ubiquinol-cytochrome C reductase hinge protein-domain-containing protein [Schizothecium vesticola]
MGFWDTITDLVEAATPWATADAEAPAAESKDMEETRNMRTPQARRIPADWEGDKTTVESSKEDEGEPEAEEEEEEDEEELSDPKEKLEAECTESKQCAPVKHHFDECVERVTGAGSDNKEDCVEEFFHLAHCASACAAPKLWSQLK